MVLGFKAPQFAAGLTFFRHNLNRRSIILRNFDPVTDSCGKSLVS